MSEMRPRTTARLYSIAARGWMTAAGLALLLPARDRLSIWLPLHLALAGGRDAQRAELARGVGQRGPRRDGRERGIRRSPGPRRRRGPLRVFHSRLPQAPVSASTGSPARW